MAIAPEAIRPPRTSVGPIGWVRSNLLSSWYNTALTIVCLTLLFFLFRAILPWVFIDADWSAITSNLKLFLAGQYPNDEMWRVGASVLMTSFLAGFSWGVWGGVGRTLGLVIAVGLGALAFLPVSLDDLGIEARLWILANPGAVGLGYLLSLTPVARPRWAFLGWVAGFALTIILLRGLEGIPGLPVIDSGLWGGLVLTFLLALVGIVASFPLGVLLALGRRSSLPVVSLLSILFIEVVRGVPLITLLFMTNIILPLFLPEGLVINRVQRALIAITLFSAAYMAENIRGGLQAVPRGQIEAGRALGLRGTYVTLFIELPQALRAVIPAIVGQFISLFKDTSLVVTVGLLDLVGIGKSIILGNVQWIHAQREVYVFLAFVFWIFTYSMAYTSAKLEVAMGVGRR